MPSKDGAGRPVTVLNMWCAEGVRAVKLTEVQRLRFANPVIENEFRRALETLALSHDSQKKAVSLHFAGEGKRKVEVGYVIENPIWKTSYRLVLDEKDKPYLQGWAVVENPTDEDWNEVTMALVSGRPISFKMDLYNPLYVNRPTVEPELFASLRPPTYSGAMRRCRRRCRRRRLTPDRIAGRRSRWPAEADAREAEQADGSGSRDGRRAAGERCATEQYADERCRETASRAWTSAAACRRAATASSLGDYFQYIIDHPVDLARQKSALLPIVNKDVEGKRVSHLQPGRAGQAPAARPQVQEHDRHAADPGADHGLRRLASTPATRASSTCSPTKSGSSATPSTWAPKSRSRPGNNTSRITSVKAVKGIVYTNTLFREERVYDVSQPQHDRPHAADRAPEPQGPGLRVQGRQQAEGRSRRRVPLRGARRRQEGPELHGRRRAAKPARSVQLTNNADDQIRYFINLKEAPPGSEGEAAGGAEGEGELGQGPAGHPDGLDTRIQTITADQKRLRENLRETPKEVAAVPEVPEDAGRAGERRWTTCRRS